MAIQPIFSGGALPANTITTQQFVRGVAEVAPAQISLAMQVSQLDREMERSADEAPYVLTDVGTTTTYDVHARVEPTPDDRRRRGSRFDHRA